MRTIVKKISLDPMKSRRFGVIPGSVPVWKTPVGNFYSYEEAKANVFKSNYSLADVSMDFEYVDIDLAKNPIGNYGLVPCDVNVNGNFYSYQTISQWYNFLIEYITYKGSDSSAENHYLIESVGGVIIEDKLNECRAMDKKYNDLNLLFGGDAYTWLNEHCFGGGDTKVDSNYVNDSDGIKHGSINIPLIITSNIDELGEMSIFSDDYKFDVFEVGNAPHELKDGEVYDRPSVFGDDNKIYQLDDTYIIDSKSNAEDVITIIDDKGNEVKAIKYYDYVINANAKDYYSNTRTHISHNGGIVYNPPSNSGSILYQTEKKFNNGFVIIEGTTYEVYINNFVTYNGNDGSGYNGREFPVLSATSNFSPSAVVIQYCNVGGKEYIAKNNKFYFKSPDGCEHDDGCEIGGILKKYIIYQGDYVVLNNDYVILDDTIESQIFRYPLISASVKIDNEMYYIVNGKLTKQDGFVKYNETFDAAYTESFPSWATGYTITGDNVKINYKYKIIDNTIITGLTSSKLLGLKDMESSVDLLGNQMPGNILFDFDVKAEKTKVDNTGRKNTKYVEPYNGMMLELPYHIANTCEIQDIDGFGLVGNILTKMSFSGYNSSNDMVSSFIVEDTTNAQFDAYSNISGKITRLFDNVDRVECEITYHIGAAIKKEKYDVDVGSGTTPYYYIIDSGKSSGITYTEHFNVILKECPYYMDDGTQIMVKYYDLESTLNRVVTNNDDGDNKFYEPTAIFSLNVNMYTTDNKWTNEKYGYDKTNGNMMSPLGRLEYMLGMTQPQTVEGDIYVDRGVNALLEKRMKLCDTMSVDALERYGNNWFNIESYD